MTFKELHAKELAKVKKPKLYKCYILDPLGEGDPTRQLDLNVDRETFGLTEEASMQKAFNDIGAENVARMLFGDFSEEIMIPADQDAHCKNFFAILEITLKNGTMDEEILVPPNKDYVMDTNPGYDPEMGIITCTIRDRIEELNMKNYQIRDIVVDFTGPFIKIDHLNLDEVITNTAITGKPIK